MYGCESWTINKGECRRIDAFELWCWRRLLRVPWTARGSNQSILKEISPGFSLEGLMLKLKLNYFGHLIQRAASFGKTLMLGKIEGRRNGGWQRMRWLDGIMDTMDMGLGGLWVLVIDRRPGMLRFMGSQGVGHDWVTELKEAECIYSIECSVTSVVSDSLQPYGLYPSRHPCHGILQARILEWVAISFARGSSQPRDQTQVSCIVGTFFTMWATREAHQMSNKGLINDQVL